MKKKKGSYKVQLQQWRAKFHLKRKEKKTSKQNKKPLQLSVDNWSFQVSSFKIFKRALHLPWQKWGFYFVSIYLTLIYCIAIIVAWHVCSWRPYLELQCLNIFLLINFLLKPFRVIWPGCLCERKLICPCDISW